LNRQPYLKFSIEDQWYHLKAKKNMNIEREELYNHLP
jgi:hypothetical protein